MVVKMTTVGRVLEAKLSGDIEKVNAHAHLVNRRKQHARVCTSTRGSLTVEFLKGADKGKN